MTEINARLLRISTGEEVLADVVSETEETITVKNPLVVLPTGQNVGFAPWASVPSKEEPETTLSKSFLVYNTSVDSAVKSKYEGMFGESKLIKPDEKKLIL